MKHNAIDETQVVVTAKKDRKTEDCIWDFITVNGLYERGKKRLLIIGDSITAGINTVIDDVINSSWAVDAFTTSLPLNDVNFIPTLKNALLQSRLPYDIIHFNNGAHGTETAKEYEEAYISVINVIKEIHPNAKLVLATTIAAYEREADGTFVKPLLSWHKYTDTRNIICRRLCKEYNLQLNDLAEYSVKIKDEHISDGIHYSEAGSKKLAFQVVKFAR